MNAIFEPSPLGRILVPGQVPPGYALFYTTADFDGHLKGGAAAKLTAFVRERFGIEAALSTCTQVHGARVARAEGGAAWHECDSCDALYSDQPQRALAIKVADCLPVTLIDAAHGVLANIHSGWRGSVQRITGVALDTLERETAFAPADARAWLGPSIRVCCFEVGEEVVEQFRASYADADAFIDRSRGPKPHIDTAGLTRLLLEKRGVTDVVDVALCTRCGPDFHSYRRTPAGGGRNLAVVAH
jgi:YfiH family protein